jgi:hypothetical protein
MKDFSRESSLGTSVITKGKINELSVMLMRQKTDFEEVQEMIAKKTRQKVAAKKAPANKPARKASKKKLPKKK